MWYKTTMNFTNGDGNTKDQGRYGFWIVYITVYQINGRRCWSRKQTRSNLWAKQTKSGIWTNRETWNFCIIDLVNANRGDYGKWVMPSDGEEPGGKGTKNRLGLSQKKFLDKDPSSWQFKLIMTLKSHIIRQLISWWSWDFRNFMTHKPYWRWS